MKNGKILWYSDRDKNGIVVDENKNEFYFDISTIKDRNDQNFKRHAEVIFTLDRISSCLCAKNVTLK